MTKKYAETHLINPDQTDYFGQLTIATIFRYMQSAATNYNQDMPQVKAIDRNHDFHWLIYFSEVQIKNFISYNQQIQITTWLEDYNKALARRIYQLEAVNTGQPIATAFTDWIYFNRAKMRPATIDPRIDELLFSESPAPKKLRRVKIKPLNSAAPVLQTTQPVTLRHLDINHHVNNTVYLDYFLDSFSLAHQTMGIDLNTYLQKGWSWVPTHYQIQYNHAAILGESVAVLAQINHITDQQAQWSFQIEKADQPKPLTIAQVTYKLRDNHAQTFTDIPTDYQKIVQKTFQLSSQNS